MLLKLSNAKVALVGMYGVVLTSSTRALADCSTNNTCLNTTNSLGIPQVGLSSAVTSIIGILSFVAGVLSAIFIIVAGIRYATSSGNSQRTEGAKQTLTYAVIGLIISVLAFSIVNFIAAKAP